MLLGNIFSFLIYPFLVFQHLLQIIFLFLTFREILLYLFYYYNGRYIQFYKFLIVDKGDIGPIESLKESWKMTKGYAWNLFLFLILIALLNILGVILFGVGLFVTIPISLLSYAILYRKLHARLIPTKTA